MKQRQLGTFLIAAGVLGSLTLASGCNRSGGASGPAKTQAQVEAGAVERASALKAQGAAQQQQSGGGGAPAYAPRGIPMGGRR